MNETSKILNQDEKVIWEGTPQFLPYVAGSIAPFLFGCIWSGAVTVFVTLALTSGGAPWFFFIFLLPFIAVGAAMLLSPLFFALSYKYIYYVITDKRVIMQSGIIGRDFQHVDYDKMTDMGVSVGILDKLLGKNAGSISLVTGAVAVGGESPHVQKLGIFLSHITDPYKVFELVKKVSYDIKSDINYPNALRPAVNEGFKTEYKGLEKHE